MKKIFVSVIMLAVFVTTMAFNVGSASARRVSQVPVVVLRSSLFEKMDVGESVPASIEGTSISCYIASNHTLRCVVPNKHEDSYVTIKVYLEGVILNFHVYVPAIVREPI